VPPVIRDQIAKHGFESNRWNELDQLSRCRNRLGAMSPKILSQGPVKCRDLGSPTRNTHQTTREMASSEECRLKPQATNGAPPPRIDKVRRRRLATDVIPALRTGAFQVNDFDLTSIYECLNFQARRKFGESGTWRFRRMRLPIMMG
jgi:hypothetical protein